MGNILNKERAIALRNDLDHGSLEHLQYQHSILTKLEDMTDEIIKVYKHYGFNEDSIRSAEALKSVISDARKRSADFVNLKEEVGDQVVISLDSDDVFNRFVNMYLEDIKVHKKNVYFWAKRKVSRDFPDFLSGV